MHPYRIADPQPPTTTRNDIAATVVCVTILSLALGCIHFAVAAADAEHDRAIYERAYEAVSGGCR